jgi:hypothetical protein
MFPLIADSNLSLQWMWNGTCSYDDFICIMDSLEVLVIEEMQNEETQLIT